MRLPRDVSGEQLIRALRKLGNEATRQRGSHVRVTTLRGGKHHEVIPKHRQIRPGLLVRFLKSIAALHRLSVQQLIRRNVSVSCFVTAIARQRGFHMILVAVCPLRF
jgi:predicted RNA binding protein YcfA (HicA-like mRNA interferase family)